MSDEDDNNLFEAGSTVHATATDNRRKDGRNQNPRFPSNHERVVASSSPTLTIQNKNENKYPLNCTKRNRDQDDVQNCQNDDMNDNDNNRNRRGLSISSSFYSQQHQQHHHHDQHQHHHPITNGEEHDHQNDDINDNDNNKKATQSKRPEPCGRTQEKLDELLEKSEFGERKNVYGSYFFVNAVGTTKHCTRADIDGQIDRCIECGCTIGEHKSVHHLQQQQIVATADLATYNQMIAAGRRTISVACNDGTEFGLLTGELLERGSSKAALFAGVRKLVALAGNQRVDKTRIPLLATVGVGGSGKSTICYALRGFLDESWRDELLGVIKEATPENVTTPKCLVVLMAGMGQTTAYKGGEDPERAVIARAYADYVLGSFEAEHSAALPKELQSLHDMLATIRKLEADKQGCLESEVAVVLCVDEVKRVREFGDSRMCSALLTAIAVQEQNELCEGRIFLPFVTSLVVSIIYQITVASKRPVWSVPLPPLTGDDGLQKVASYLMEQRKKNTGSLSDKAERNIRAAVWASGGHLRTLENMMNHEWALPYAFPGINTGYKTKFGCALLECFLHLLASEDGAVRETQTFSGCTIEEMLAEHLICYTAIDFKEKCFVIKVLPWALRLADDVRGELERESKVLRDLLNHLNQTGDLEKHFEIAIPMALELKARAHLRRKSEVDFDSVATSPHVRLHEGDSKLFFSEALLQADCFADPQTVPQLKHAEHTSASDDLRCVVSEKTNEKGLELWTRKCTVRRQRKCETITLCWQMWNTQLSPNTLNDIVEKGQSAMQELGIDTGLNYLVLCTSAPLSKAALSELPSGVIVLGAEACVKLLEPYGAPPLATLIQAKSNRATEQGSKKNEKKKRYVGKKGKATKQTKSTRKRNKS